MVKVPYRATIHTIALACTTLTLLTSLFVSAFALPAGQTAAPGACEKASGAACEEPESCCAGAEDVAKELGRG